MTYTCSLNDKRKQSVEEEKWYLISYTKVILGIVRMKSKKYYLVPKNDRDRKSEELSTCSDLMMVVRTDPLYMLANFQLLEHGDSIIFQLLAHNLNNQKRKSMFEFLSVSERFFYMVSQRGCHCLLKIILSLSC